MTFSNLSTRIHASLARQSYHVSTISTSFCAPGGLDSVKKGYGNATTRHDVEQDNATTMGLCLSLLPLQVSLASGTQ